MSTELFKFQVDLQEQGYTQVSKKDLRNKTYSIVGTDILVADNNSVDKFLFTDEGVASGVKTSIFKLKVKDE